VKGTSAVVATGQVASPPRVHTLSGEDVDETYRLQRVMF